MACLAKYRPHDTNTSKSQQDEAQLVRKFKNIEEQAPAVDDMLEFTTHSPLIAKCQRAKGKQVPRKNDTYAREESNPNLPAPKQSKSAVQQEIETQEDDKKDGRLRSEQCGDQKCGQSPQIDYMLVFYPAQPEKDSPQ